MTQSLSLESRVARLEARNAITELSAQYAVACDVRDLDLLGSLFTEDAVLDTPNGSMQASGRAAIVALFERVLAIRGPGFHWTHDPVIRFLSDTEATGTIFCHAETTPNGVQSVAALRYDDAYRRDGDCWRIARRVLNFFYYVPAADYAEALARPDRVVVAQGRIAADYPEKTDTWRAFAGRRTQ
ncbi:MAG: nuclear transport factor 2 family protein [Rhodobacter sp.]|uniref:nuclear transport factor 2 family protein n=1 Tax=Pararhodobacter sp. TaxID=2127056 RepID=UPI001E0BD2D5|nr:nuclear transport factor 2 family protein [Pararhodobacter sp.]MCB1347065.1 nuclear transport factor 2 family protein [Paracoccaceae bacterium]MCC0074456.1 nuclear transport factor 2 family protein [Rhodobacter sp.]HPD93172.1 nuclear transport factor 2 family protein [Pararhodobacter sp.]